MKINEQVKIFLESLTSKEARRWATSLGDQKFFHKCARTLKRKLKVKTVLDIACGAGQFVDICRWAKMEAYGINPSVDEESSGYIYSGTFESALKNQDLLGNEKFDCITIQNTLHGKYWEDDEIRDLLTFMKKHSKYIVISDPIQNPNVELNGLKQIHAFRGSHGNQTVFHKIYEVVE